MESLFLDSHQCQKQSLVNNSVGTICDDELLIYQDDMTLIIRMVHLAKISFHIRRNYFVNFIFFVLAIACVLAVLYVVTTFLEYIILVGIFISAIILSFTAKFMNYTFLIIRFNLTFTEVKIKSNQIKDAKELVVLVNQKLKER